MEVSNSVISSLMLDAGTERTIKARRYQIQNRVEFEYIDYADEENFEFKAKVYGSELYEVFVVVEHGEIEDITCTCPDYKKHYGVCKHSLAAVLDLKEKNFRRKMGPILSEISGGNNKNKYRTFKQIVNNMYDEELSSLDELKYNEISEENKLKIEPKMVYDKYERVLKMEFKLGNKRMYKLKNLREFYDRMINKEFYRYGNQLEFVHTRENFQKDSQKLLDFIMKYAEIIKYANKNSSYGYYGKQLSEVSIIVGNSGIDELFEIMEGKSCVFENSYLTEKIEFINEDPKIDLKLEKTEKDDYIIEPNINIYDLLCFRGKENEYMLYENKIYKLSKEFEQTKLKFIKMLRENYISTLELGEEDLSDFFAIIMPKLKNQVEIKNIKEEEIEKYKPKKLGVKVYLDFDQNEYITADIRFCYDEQEFNPLNDEENIKVPRNKIEETKAINIFKKTGFMYDAENKRLILPEEDMIYKFLSEDIQEYMKKFEVMVTDNFKTKEIVKPKIETLGVRIENNLLELDLSKIDFDIKEIEEIMQKYKLKKKYHKLKDGTYLSLEENEEIEFLDKIVSGMDVSYKDLEEGEIRLPVNRSLYLNQLLKGIKGTEIIKNKEYKEIVNNLNQEMIEEENEIPEKLNAELRYYQKIGYNWLLTLDKYKMGGILADDMGLGKTIQVLAIILQYVEECKIKKEERKTSIVISPSSLTLNWLGEARKFAPDLKVNVINGNTEERKEKIENLDKYDLIITSYDLVKRDIEKYKEKDYIFRYAITDEAQYLKNSNTQNAKAVKKINAISKFALTGTPIENSLAELWSIFDFVMPGYLFTYKKFKQTYETPIVKENDEKALNKLKMLIEPFVLRRTKKEVLKELPEKTITVLNNEMEEEQKNIYLSYLMQAKEEVSNEIDIKGFNGSQIKILAALTRLRQICCHPGLFIENYKGESSKLNQCMDLIEEGVKAGHKILIFSTYTSMFEFLEDKLYKMDIKYFKLTGGTKVSKRIEMVDEFNENPEIKVFLISLKAGGTGLNLTGADMVIHYDPWWNLSAENQATDRAYRIGQKNNVQVYKLITNNSIEEKIYELQEKKSKLAENMLSTKTTFVSKLSKDEIMNLFS